jgi:hypothetical protein
MSTNEKTRVNFSKEILDKTFDKQGGQCWKCGKPLTYGYVAHHIDGNNANAAEENCALVHTRCHESEQWATFKKQREGTLKEIQDTLGILLSPQGIAGAALKEANILIEKEMTIQNQLYGCEVFERPASERLEYSKLQMQAQLEAFTAGYQECLKNLPNILQGKQVKIDTKS